ncbi:MAG TPA: RloB domain-containing protein [Chloroflexi bacterium]|nr:MAG: abortive phage infection protein [Anaerolineaceae bacterium 4572_5.2]HEY84362.1 RloB domain-containing protein [Chloroflexota bacterium]
MAKERRHHHRPKRLARKVGVRSLRDKFLIVCEGVQTEPKYFSSFRVSKEVKVVGVGGNTDYVVREAIRLMDQDDFDQVWCVFDRDTFPVQNFNNALSLAKSHKIRVAYSNEAFEIWYLLHFHYHDTALSRSQYAKKLKTRSGFKYQKNADNMYELLENRQPDAIRNAERLLRSYIPHNPVKDNPCTTVHHLVQELNKFAV